MPIDSELLRAFATSSAAALAAGLSGTDAVDVAMQRQTAIVQIDAFIDKHVEALGLASGEFVVEIVSQATGAWISDSAGFTASLEALSADELADLAEADASMVEQLATEILGARKELIADLQQAVGTLARAALAAGVAGLAGMDSTPDLHGGAR
jgi:F0F1-type ATP synthase membrane subunit b/b'